jgi:glycosyltransferase involved in cell wall biosynthesis
VSFEESGYEVRILICALDGPEPRTNGIRLAVGALLDELRKTNQIRYIGYRMPDQRSLDDSAEMRLIEPPPRPLRGATMLRATLRRRPWGADRLAAGLEDLLAREVQTFEPEVVHVTRWMLAGLGRTISDVGSVLTAFDAWHLNVDAALAVTSPLRRPLMRAEARRIRRFEADEFEYFRRVVVVSEQDKVELNRLNPDLQISVIPNGVDAEFFSDSSVTPTPGHIVFTGAMSYPPNIVAADYLVRDLLPRIRAAQPDAHVTLVGRDPHRDVLQLTALEGVEVTGEVDDIRPWLRRAAVFVCPMLSGTGIKNKLLEAMASQLPCVVTPLALQGIDACDDEQVLVGRTADELAAHVVTILRNETTAQRLGRAARAYVRSRHSWPDAALAYERVYKEVQLGARS